MPLPNPSLDRPFAIRLSLGLYAALASLRLAVVLISVSGLMLAWATLVESRYGAEAVRFGIYGTWWFSGLTALLGANVFCSAAIRFPWKRHQTGFLITHAGVLVLLIGCLLSRMGGVDAKLPIFEGRTAHVAYEDSQHFDLKVHPRSVGLEQTIEVPFASGPFNWRDYNSSSLLRTPGKRYDTLYWFPWWLARRDRGILYDQDGIKLEVLDYYSDSNLQAALPLKLRTSVNQNQWSSLQLEIRGTDDPHSSHAGGGKYAREKLSDGRWVVYWLAGSLAETEAFRESLPDGALSPNGQVVLHAGGKSYRFSVEELQELKRVSLGDTGIEAELAQFEPAFPHVILLIHRPGDSPHRMVLYADIPEFNKQDAEHAVFGTYWYDVSEGKQQSANEAGESAAERMQSLRRERIDVVQGADQKLYYRTWKSERGSVRELPVNGDKVVTYEEGGSPVSLYVEQFVPHDRPGLTIVPARFAKQNRQGYKQRQARLRLTVDGNSEEFWLAGMMPDPFSQEPDETQRKLVHGQNRRVAITLANDRIDVGFQLYLQKFQRKLDPGTGMASHYSSLVDLLEYHDENRPGDNPSKRLKTDILITLNEPVNFSDQRGGRSYRVYQESFRGPYKPGEFVFEEVVDPDSRRDELYISWLTANYDPGRGLKYLGSLLMTAGIAVMFYMRAYFFRRVPQARAKPSE